MSEAILIVSSTPDAELAEKLARDLVSSGLAACVQISSPVKSFYRWKGEMEIAEEHQLWIKSRAEQFEKISERIRALHSYEIPEILSIRMENGLPQYLEWLDRETSI